MPAATRLLPLALAAMLLSACAPAGTDSERIEPTVAPVYPQLSTNPDVPVLEDLVYGEADGAPLLADACLPPEDPTPAEPAPQDEPGARPDAGAGAATTVAGASGADAAAETAARPAVVVIHGGSWARGDKASFNWRAVCQWLASEGFVAVSINYRLAPAAVFPAQLEDAAAAVEWLRRPEQVSRLNIDPDHIGAFGGSAGGHLAALLGASGVGDWSSGSRVAAVVDLSGPADLRDAIPATDTTGDPFVQAQLAFLGCDSLDECAIAAEASPVTLVDSSDPPFFIAHSTEEFIPVMQSNALATALREVGVPVTYVTVDGAAHSIAMLDETMMARIVDFLRAALSARTE